jgi:hypothetical protein
VSQIDPIKETDEHRSTVCVFQKTSQCNKSSLFPLTRLGEGGCSSDRKAPNNEGSIRKLHDVFQLEMEMASIRWEAAIFFDQRATEVFCLPSTE